MLLFDKIYMFLNLHCVFIFVCRLVKYKVATFIVASQQMNHLFINYTIFICFSYYIDIANILVLFAAITFFSSTN